MRYIDDIYVIINNNCTCEKPLETCNAQNPAIQFTFELGNEVDGLVYLDTQTLFTPTFTCKLYIKPVHSNAVLHATYHVPNTKKKQKSAGQLKDAKITKILWK